MSKTEKFAFLGDKDEEHTIDSKDLVTVIQDPAGASSTVIYVESSKTDPAAPPQVKLSKAISPPPPSAGPDFMSGRETHVIVSAGSGTGQAGVFYEHAVKPVLDVFFHGAKNAYQVHYTASVMSIINLTNDIIFPRVNEGHLQRIILLSGDGGIVDIINSLLSRPISGSYKPPQVFLLPLGTANALFHSIDIRKDNTWGLSSLPTDNHRPLPIFAARFSPGARLLVNEAQSEEGLPKDPQTGQPTLYGAVVFSWGMHASLVADSDTAKYRKFGVERFKMAATEALFPADGSLPHAYKAKVCILCTSPLGDESWRSLPREEHMYVLATMVSNLEKTFTISPASKPLDGSLHLVHFGPTDGNEAMRLMGLAYQDGKHVDDPAVGYQAIEGLRIEFEGKEEDSRWRRICVDGKIVRLEEKGWVELRKVDRHVLDVACGSPAA
ncbi:hypothetical protein K469DRAFT_720200 [Zopfia rhizophila CBS 207.26]|uniref:DAGKc domain-containing protein n=1 Tax=Zopfia rhizophila CBS 207.26 TaxID=1314779 RepID=A0A6A6EIG2_9PEZI|nr:hypothetical protein K469DRAFT_720200 [Zopfia rhizophila CBS 207.26]